jgi:hypothetical protein
VDVFQRDAFQLPVTVKKLNHCVLALDADQTPAGEMLTAPMRADTDVAADVLLGVLEEHDYIPASFNRLLAASIWRCLVNTDWGL